MSYPLLLPPSEADPRTRWFAVGRARAKRAGVGTAALGGLGGTLAVSLALAAADGGTSGGARLVLVTLAVLLLTLVAIGVRRIWRIAGDRRARLGVGPQGVWWCEQEVAFLFPWQVLAGTAVLSLRTRTSKSSYFIQYLELFTVAGAVPLHPVLDRLVIAGRYRLELPDARLLGGLLPLTTGFADPLSEALAGASPGRWWGRQSRDWTEADRMR
ncbi:hypothetical protein DSC45_28555 [Streptomyces sp. YIM 130001]|uniref:hypothetical protein n=1 Tax=Streptomyces sp. YIM 130001 TaxID=2259644 RepID=UPI000E64791A|nr:hypothetical protein [Streptomyces sp. YIM 130001]RII11242.1 hypothetical protein DSC45_28555 [Streptomyces sp. YIM 130001]